MTTQDVHYVPRGTLAYDVTRLGLAMRLCGFALRRGLRDSLIALRLSLMPAPTNGIVEPRRMGA